MYFGEYLIENIFKYLIFPKDDDRRVKDSWEDEEEDTGKGIKESWDDEDDVKESWEDEEEKRLNFFINLKIYWKKI